MKATQVGLGMALVAAAALLAFGERGGAGDLAEPVARPEANSANSGQGVATTVSSHANSTQSAPTAEPVHAEGVKLRPTATNKPSTESNPTVLALVDRRGEPKGIASRGDGRLFAPQSWAPRVAPTTAVSTPPPPPQAPPLPISFVGWQTQGGKVEAFLAQGDKVHIVRAGSLIEGGGYRVDSIDAKAVVFTYLPLQQTQKLAIQVND